jgi:two-component system, sensor histidine kinase and response regulator
LKVLQIKNYSLNGLFLIFIILAAMICSGVTIGALYYTLDPTLREFQEKEHETELELSGDLFENFINNQLLSYQDLAQMPIVVNGVMGGVKDDADLIDFLKNFRILGKLDPVVVVDINFKRINQRGEFPFDLNSFLSDEKKPLSQILEGESPFYIKIVEVNNSYLMALCVPVLYSGFTEGLLLVEVPLSQNSILNSLNLGPSKSLVLSQDGVAYSNNIGSSAKSVFHHPTSLNLAS